MNPELIDAIDQVYGQQSSAEIIAGWNNGKFQREDSYSIRKDILLDGQLENAWLADRAVRLALEVAGGGPEALALAEEIISGITHPSLVNRLASPTARTQPINEEKLFGCGHPRSEENVEFFKTKVRSGRTGAVLS